MEVSNRVDVITTSVRGWNRYMKPLIDSIERHEEITSNIIIIDAGGFYPSNYKDVTILHTSILNCSEAQNIGLKYSFADWILVLDCDVLCTGKFTDFVPSLKAGIHGKKMHGRLHEPFTAPYPWLDGWIYAFPREIYEAVGGFDENFQGSGFEDADFCWRARKMSYPTMLTNLPFTHLSTASKKEISGEYKKVRLGNVEYLKNKWKLK